MTKSPSRAIGALKRFGNTARLIVEFDTVKRAVRQFDAPVLILVAPAAWRHIRPGAIRDGRTESNGPRYRRIP